MDFHSERPPIVSGRRELAAIVERSKVQTLEQRVEDLEDYIFCLKAELKALWAQKADIPNQLGPPPPRIRSHAIGLHNGM